MIKIALITLVMLIAPNIVLAQCQDDFSMRTGAWSEHHISSERDDGTDWNQTHNAFGFECNNVGIMYFENSWGEETLGVYYDLDLVRLDDKTKLGVHGGFWGGYQEISPATAGIIPVLGGKIEYRHNGDYRPGPSVEFITFGVVSVVALKWHMW